jgi:hypothetical protein
MASSDSDGVEVARAVDDFFDRAARDYATWWYPPEVLESIARMQDLQPYKAVPFAEAYQAGAQYPEDRLLGCVNRLTDIRLQLHHISYDLRSG